MRTVLAAIGGDIRSPRLSGYRYGPPNCLAYHTRDDAARAAALLRLRRPPDPVRRPAPRAAALLEPRVRAVAEHDPLPARADRQAAAARRGSFRVDRGALTVLHGAVVLPYLSGSKSGRIERNVGDRSREELPRVEPPPTSDVQRHVCRGRRSPDRRRRAYDDAVLVEPNRRSVVGPDEMGPRLERQDARIGCTRPSAGDVSDVRPMPSSSL